MTRRAVIDRNQVREAVEEAELRTSAEIVVSIAPFFIGNVERAAHRAFAHLGIAQTQRRNGVLVFVVPARQQVFVLSDRGADASVDSSIWNAVASHIAKAFARGAGTAGLVDGVRLLAHALSAPFPHDCGDANELPDHPQVG